MPTRFKLLKKNRVTSNSFINDLIFEIASPDNAQTKRVEKRTKLFTQTLQTSLCVRSNQHV